MDVTNTMSVTVARSLIVVLVLVLVLVVRVLVVVDRGALGVGVATFGVDVGHGGNFRNVVVVAVTWPRLPGSRRRRGLAGLVRRATTHLPAVRPDCGISTGARTPAARLLRRPRDDAEPRGRRARRCTRRRGPVGPRARSPAGRT